MKNTILQYISQADKEQIQDLLDAVIERYKLLYPDWDILYFSIPKLDREGRRLRWEQIMAFAEKYGNL